jgi:hypothetical protein
MGVTEPFYVEIENGDRLGPAWSLEAAIQKAWAADAAGLYPVRISQAYAVIYDGADLRRAIAAARVELRDG